MKKALNLDDINRVANAGAPRDGVFVSRRFLAQVHAELYSARNQQAVLDHDPYLRPGDGYTPALGTTA